MTRTNTQLSAARISCAAQNIRELSESTPTLTAAAADALAAALALIDVAVRLSDMPDTPALHPAYSPIIDQLRHNAGYDLMVSGGARSVVVLDAVVAGLSAAVVAASGELSAD